MHFQLKTDGLSRRLVLLRVLQVMSREYRKKRLYSCDASGMLCVLLDKEKSTKQDFSTTFEEQGIKWRRIPNALTAPQIVNLAGQAEAIAVKLWGTAKSEYRLVFEITHGLRVRDYDISWEFDPVTGAERRLVLWAQFLGTDRAIVQVNLIPGGNISEQLKERVLAELNQCGSWEAVPD